MSQKDEIIRLLQETPTMTQGDLSIAMYGDNKHEPNIYGALMSLVKRGIVIRTGSRPSYYTLSGVEAIIPIQEDVEEDEHPKIRYGKQLPLDTTLDSLVNNHGIDMDRGNNLVKLTKSNSAIIEGLIGHDYGYIPFAKMIYKQLCQSHNGVFPNDEYAWTALVRIIDLDNSTQVWRFHRQEFPKIIAYILEPSHNFISRLQRGDIALVDELKECIQLTDIKSLPSKICKYTSEYMGFGDKYFINDYYIRSMLPFYLDYYQVDWKNICDKKALTQRTRREFLSYSVLFKLLDALLNKVNELEQEPLTRNELDHIIWYCYKSYSRD